ncbi:alpha/beta hydrolase [Burkholderia glumae]|uniref:Alpha/beta hydrolase n=3 Tax=Burkholderia glumae TaxID=337 RepID=A0AAP9Y202_BURGL|nr:alpha/beta hydrolase [Burkholderia glumae]AJY66930.1 alpha/beta hydrolase fold family protein [Burkholderia glumae LMG 2196 = ATCC 33617]MCM2491206.1 alpha/beta hydrolase [Burkholderia glumae]MCM2536332.1 alpha/beta hydrolase [Burkholderia glumae]MCM2542199.1 alpha/beta hydrolase [Burkholderia glumae]MCM2548968.1 alpha/beta hydrolase [Burkholderia glumae]
MSWQSTFACWLLRRQIRPKTLSPVIDVTQARVLAARRRVLPTRPPAGWRLRESGGARADGSPRGEWLEPADGRATPTLLYFHGGGYYFCSPATHRPLVFALSRKLGARSFSVDYRLAPEHPFPAAHDDALAAYAALLEAGVEPASILIGGDSAGGGLALALLVALRDRGAPLPAGALLFSPWTDLAATGDTLRSNDGLDPMFSGAALGRAARLYIGGASPTDPYLSPLYADPAGLPPLLIQVGSTEVLLDDSRRFAERAQAAGVATELQIWPGMPHVWQMAVPFMPEASRALDQAAAFGRRLVERAAQPAPVAA